MDFFQYFPKEYYNLDRNKNSLDIVTNITRRFMIDNNVKTNASAYYEYVVSDGETPEHIAHKVYGNSNRHWIILMMNDIVDPQADWPMDVNSINKFIEKKYEVQANGSPVINWTKLNVRSYYKSLKRTNPSTKFFRREVIEIDSDAYANVSNYTSYVTLQSGDTIVCDTEKFTETYYDYEIRINEKKRRIKILKNEFVDALIKELEGIFEV